jgi:SSS family solute:Na+ symporter
MEIRMGTEAAIALGLVSYAVLMLGFSFFLTRRIAKTTDYLMGSRNFPFWILIGSVTAANIGTGVIVGASGLAYQHGWAGSAYPIGLGLGTALVGILFAGMRRYRFMTLSEEVASYYGKKRVVVEFSNITLFFAQLCWLTVQIMGGAALLAATTQLPRHWCTVAAALITAGIAIPGGLKSVVYTDFLQAAILLTGFFVLTHSALLHSGGWIGLRHSVPPSYFSFLGGASYGRWKVAGLMVALMASAIADPGRRLSMYSARSQNGARWAMIIAGIIVIVFSAVVGITGMYTYNLNQHLANPDESLIWLVMNVLPSWLAALVVVSVVSGIISCANWNAIAAGTFFVRHIYPMVTGRYAARPLLAVRLALICSFVISTSVAIHAGSIVGFVVKFLPVTLSGLAVIIMVGRFWRRSTWQGALAALIATPIASLAVMFAPASLGFLNNAVIPTLVGVVVQIIVSVLTPPTSPDFEQVAKEMRKERSAMEEEPDSESATAYEALPVSQAHGLRH